MGRGCRPFTRSVQGHHGLPGAASQLELSQKQTWSQAKFRCDGLIELLLNTAKKQVQEKEPTKGTVVGKVHHLAPPAPAALECKQHFTYPTPSRHRLWGGVSGAPCLPLAASDDSALSVAGAGHSSSKTPRSWRMGSEGVQAGTRASTPEAWFAP